MSKAVLLLLLLAFSSCSLKYDENHSGTDSSPELEFKDADYKKYEDNKLSTQIQAQTLEQYKDSSTYAKNARFKTWNSGGDLLTEGYCALLGINSDTKIYTLFNEIFIDNIEQNFKINAESLKWNSETKQMVSTKDGNVKLTRSDIEIQGSGFSASGASKSFEFTNPVTGTITTDDNESNGEDFSEE